MFLPNLLEFQRASFIKPISTSFFASGTKEIRVWVGFGNISLRGFILQKLPARAVNATYLVEQNGSKRLIKRNLENSGGRNDLVFAELEQLGGFSIPDQCENSAPELAEEDADVVIIETINNGEKRSIKYSGIPLSHQEHAVLVRSICETLERRYEINLLR